MRSLYHASPLRLRVNAFSRVLRAAYHDTLYASVEAGSRRETVDAGEADAPYCVETYRGRLKLCPSSGLVFDDAVLLKGSSDRFMRERVPDYGRVYDRQDRHVPIAISLRHGAEANYWHYFQLVATKAVIADLHGMDPGIPLVLSRRQADVPFIRRTIELGVFGGRSLIIQENDEVLAADEILVIRPPLHGPVYRDVLLDRLQIRGDSEVNDRLFVTRGKSAENDRRLQNEAEVERALEPFGFRTVDPQAYSLDDQMRLFAGCRFMISPHGAGLTNMIFRRGAPLDVIEIFNANLVNPCYRIVAEEYGFRHAQMVCETVSGKPRTAKPLVDVATLVDQVRDMAP